mmetsp:Transcript_41251/g.95861  ORF Transcript_41251/g.95861 Transcript_41251/m.95861 type:complete len:299 (-) Transcript_41251:139-1035(-)
MNSKHVSSLALETPALESPVSVRSAQRRSVRGIAFWIESLIPVSVPHHLEAVLVACQPHLRHEAARLAARGSLFLHELETPVVEIPDNIVGRWLKHLNRPGSCDLVPIDFAVFTNAQSDPVAVTSHPNKISIMLDDRHFAVRFWRREVIRKRSECANLRVAGVDQHVLAGWCQVKVVNLLFVAEPHLHRLSRQTPRRVTSTNALSRGSQHRGISVCPMATRMQHLVWISILPDLESLPTIFAERQGEAENAFRLHLHLHWPFPQVETTDDEIFNLGNRRPCACREPSQGPTCCWRWLL